jgi:Icc-related predicted phosphoesterase
VWRKCPANVDIMLTHGPVLGHGDLCFPLKNRAGCVDLLRECAERIKPKYHISGHIHEGYGISTDGTTKFVNASICTQRYKASNAPIVIDVPKPAGWVPGV